MGDPKTIRFNDAADQDRLTRFEKALKRSASNGSEVIRQLTDSYIRYVDEEGHAPSFPVRLVPVEPAVRKRPGKSP